ncbi:monovalent cation/H(+) antiporter subunit G [Mesorhizobium sp. CAU 1732]|uniref:monovalent cation/H(+) antiporter subunit G n=1 Tax=Mesorhizobium sp. CAU 1732 TaxID=3140358 RepID=UPI0032612CAB
MSEIADLPLWAAIPVAVFLLIGSGLALIGSFGFYRLPNFYDRIHAPTLGTSWGAGGIIIASMIFFTVLDTRLVIHEILLGVFVTITTPVTLMLLGRAALYRDRSEGSKEVPAMDPSPGVLDEAEPVTSEEEDAARNPDRASE